MKAFRILTLTLLLLLTGVAQAQMNMAIPMDTAVRMGKLPNGLTYYIRHNNWPEHRANFYIAQKVGSLQEEESQRGLAHFLEHMCFNGTEHFNGNDLIEWCRSKGIEFGGDLNAYTSIDQTVYNIDNVPTNSQATLDSCLLILYDWANGLKLDPKEIDKERGVIHEEWRMRSSANQRMLERALPKLYPGSKYGLRMPIGLMSVIDNFKPKELRDYYEKWYNPENQGIIVVGDVDVNHVEQTIKKLFGPIKSGANAGVVKTEPVPDNDKPIVVVEKDKEQQVGVFLLNFKHDAFPDSLRNTLVYMVQRYVTDLATGMLNARYSEATEKSDCPYVQAGASDGSYLLSRSKDAFLIEVVPKDGKNYEAISAALQEAERAAEFGFTATEYARSKENMLSALDKMYSNKDKRTNSQFYNEIKANFLDNDAMPSIDMYYQTMKQLVPNIPLEAVNTVMKELVSKSDSNLVVLNFNTEKEGATYPTEAGILGAIAKARAAKLTPYVDNVKNEPLLKTLPKPGKIVKETENKTLGYKELTLSNGIKVMLKKTDFKKDQVLMSSECPGGSSQFGLSDKVNIDMFNDVISSSGLGDFTSTELRKALAGKIANANLELSSMTSSISGSSTPKDVETMLQLAYLYFTNIKKDTASYNKLISGYEVELKNRALNPMSAWQDSISATLYNHNPRFAPMELKDLKKVNYDRILQMAKIVTANPASYVFTFIGNFDEDSIRPLICRYLGSLPAKNKAPKGKRLAIWQKGSIANHFTRKMETPQAIDAMIWWNDKMPYTQENGVKIDMAARILEMIYLKSIREDASAAYSVNAFGNMMRSDDGYVKTVIEGVCPMKPEKADVAMRIMKEEIQNLTKKCDPEQLKKVKELLLKQADTSFKNNGYWMGILEQYRKTGQDWHSNYKNIINSVTPQDICNVMKEFLKNSNLADVSMMPKEEKK